MQRFRLILSAETTKTLILHETVSTKPPKVAIPLDVFVESIKNHCVFEGHFSKSIVFTSIRKGGHTLRGDPRRSAAPSAATRRDPGRTSDGDSVDSTRTLHLYQLLGKN